MATDPLAEWAQGQGEGAFSPQQGSALPVTLDQWAQGQGGGALPIAPQPQSPIPLQAPQAGPTMPVPGAPNVVDQLLAQHLKALQAYPTMTWGQRMRGGAEAYSNALTQLPELQKIAATRSQAQQNLVNFHKELGSHLKNFSELTDQQRAEQAPLYKSVINSLANVVGAQIPDEELNHALSAPDLTKQYARILTDPLYGDPQANLQQIAATKPGSKERSDLLGSLDTQAKNQANVLLQSKLPQFVASLGGSTDKPISADQFNAAISKNAEIQDVLKKSPVLAQHLYDTLNGKDNEKMLAGWGLKPGGVFLAGMEAKAKELAKGFEVGQPIKDALARMNLTPATATAQDITQATTLANNMDVDQKRKISYNDAMAIAQSKGDIPLALSMPNKKVIAVSSGVPVNPSKSWNQAIKDVGEVVPLDPKEAEAYHQIVTMKADIAQLASVVAKMKGSGPGQVLQAWYASKTGQNVPEYQAMEAYKELITRYQKALTGTGRFVISEAALMAGGFPDFSGTPESNLNRLKVTADVLQNQQDAYLGKLGTTDLQQKIEDAKKQVLKMRADEANAVSKTHRMVVYPDGSTAMKPRGSTLGPGQKWAGE